MAGKLTWSQERGWYECWTCQRPAVLVEQWSNTNKYLFSCYTCFLDRGNSIADDVNWLEPKTEKAA